MFQGNSMNILLVEDDEFARNIASILLRQIKGVNLFEVENGEAALRVLETADIDLIVTDIMMPKMDGMELIKKVRALPSREDIYIIVMTAIYDVEEKIRALDLGANDYITKPFDHQEMIARVTAGARTVHLQKQLKEINKKLAEAVEFKRLMLSRLAHDLRTPVTIINGYLGLLMEISGKSESPEIERYFNTIKQQARYIDALCTDVLDYTAIEIGRLEMNMQRTDILPIIKESVELNKPYALAKGIEIKLESEGELPLVEIDPHRINAVFWNLINNSVKYGHRNTEVKVRIKQNTNKLRISIIDQGVGIPKKEQDKLFEFFTRTSAHPTGGERSLGLGLAITKRIIDLHRGEIQVISVPGKGSTFTVALPITSNQ